MPAPPDVALLIGGIYRIYWIHSLCLMRIGDALDPYAPRRGRFEEMRMQMVKVRRVGNSNVISLSREFESQGFTPGTTVIVEALPSGELRITAAETVRRITPERARQLAEQHKELL